MPPRNRKLRRKAKSKRLKVHAANLGIGLISLIVIGFIVSGFDRLFFNDGINTEFPDLSTLITQTHYEKKTGHKIGRT